MNLNTENEWLCFLKNNNNSNFANTSTINLHTNSINSDDDDDDYDDCKINIEKVIPEKNFNKNCSTIYINKNKNLIFEHKH